MTKQTLSKPMILTTIILMDLLTGMEFDLFVPSFPALQAHFALSPSWVEALLSVNFIGYCVSLFFLGRLSDRHGRRSIIIIGLLIFVLGSLLCVVPSSYGLLLLGRLFQGVGIAAPAILSFLIIADSYPLKEQQFLMGVMNGAMNIAVALAPVIGSYIAYYFNWKGNFIVLLLMGVIILAMTIAFIPNDKNIKKYESVSLEGLSGYAKIFKSKSLLLLVSTLLLTFIPYWIFVGMSPLLYIKEFGVSLTHFGYYQGSLAFVFAIGSIIYGLVIKHFTLSQHKMLQAANLIFMLSLLAIGGISFLNSHNPLLITIAILIFIIGQIVPTIILYPVCLNFMPEVKGRVSALLQGVRLILTGISLQFAGYIYTGSFQNIGFILLAFIMVSIICLHYVLKNREIMSRI